MDLENLNPGQILRHIERHLHVEVIEDLGNNLFLCKVLFDELKYVNEGEIIKFGKHNDGKFLWVNSSRTQVKKSRRYRFVCKKVKYKTAGEAVFKYSLNYYKKRSKSYVEYQCYHCYPYWHITTGSNEIFLKSISNIVKMHYDQTFMKICENSYYYSRHKVRHRHGVYIVDYKKGEASIVCIVPKGKE